MSLLVNPKQPDKWKRSCSFNTHLHSYPLRPFLSKRLCWKSSGARLLIPFAATHGELSMERNSGVNSKLMLKSGINQLHRDVFYFDRNEYFAWRSTVQVPTPRIPEIRNHQGSFTLGCPTGRITLFLVGEIPDCKRKQQRG